MSKITCILDACSVINMIHIDEEEFIIKKLDHLKIVLSEMVFKEIEKNAFIKITKLRRSRELKETDINHLEKEVSRKISIFRGLQVLNESVIKDFGTDYYDHVKKLTNYKKENGEFYSAALALYMSREIPTKLFFHTDDFPAHEEFSPFFIYQQIGYIEDSADLLVLLYRLDDTFTINQLDAHLSKLFSEYATDVSSLEKKLKEIYAANASSFVKDASLKENINYLVKSLSTQNFKGINEIKDYFYQSKSKYKLIYETLEEHNSVFDLESNSNSLLKKITELRAKIKTDSIYKI